MKKCPHCGSGMKKRTRKNGEGAGWTCNPCANRRAKSYKLSSPERVLDSKLWTLYRIRLKDFNRMAAQQMWRCAGCGVHASELRDKYPRQSRGVNGNGLHIDHDHLCCPSSQGGRTAICGKCIRGLLCPGCNIAIGMVSENPERLERLASYIRKHRARTGYVPVPR